MSFSTLANRTVGWVAVGGSLKVDDGHLMFTPNFFERTFFRREEWLVPVADIVETTTEPGRFSPGELFSGGLRARLAVVLDDGRRELFVVPDIPKVCQAIADAKP